MKRLLTVAALILTIGVGSFVVNADSPRTPNILPRDRNPNFSLEDREEWYKERKEIQKDRIQRSIEEGRMTESEAKEWEEHFSYMERFHNKNGFMSGGCGGYGYGMGGRRGMGMGKGMMRGNRW